MDWGVCPYLFLNIIKILPLNYNIHIVKYQMSTLDHLPPRSRTIDHDKQNRRGSINQQSTSKGSKRKPKLMARNKIMQKLFPNYHTIQDKQAECMMREELYTFRREKRGDEQVFKELLLRQRQKYEVIFMKYGILDRPQTEQVGHFLRKGMKKGSSQTYRQ